VVSSLIQLHRVDPDGPWLRDALGSIIADTHNDASLADEEVNALPNTEYVQLVGRHVRERIARARTVLDAIEARLPAELAAWEAELEA
jgi:hypothetical protein